MDSFPECFTFRYYSVNVSRQLGARLNEVPLERSILVDFAAFHLDSLNGKLNGTREENMPGSKWTQHEESSPQRLKRCLARNLHIFAPMGRHVGQCKNRQPIFSFIHPTPCVRWGGRGVNPSSPFPILQVCRTASKNWVFLSNLLQFLFQSLQNKNH